MAQSLANGFLLASTGFSFFPWIMEQKLALSKENVLLVLELVYSSSAGAGGGATGATGGGGGKKKGKNKKGKVVLVNSGGRRGRY